MTERDLGVTIHVNKNVVMWHVCLAVGRDMAPRAVVLTQNPLEGRDHALVVMYKTRSHACGMQVGRYVRRTFDVEVPCETHRASRPVEAMIGYTCHGGFQHPPETGAPWYPVILHVAETPIGRLLDEVRGGHNAARVRYSVYEIRCDGEASHRGVTNKYNTVEDRFRRCPPDTLVRPDVVLVGRFATDVEARIACDGMPEAHDGLWTRRPSLDYLRRILRIENGELVWTCDGSAATRRYDFMAVVIGPHVYTATQVYWALEHGAWLDFRTDAGRRAKYRA